MLIWLKSMAGFGLGWVMSGTFTVFQIAFAKVMAPEKYEWVMDMAGSVAVPAWHFVCQFSEVVWEFLNTS